MTDKFLWDLYNLIEEFDDAFTTILPPIRTMKETWFPDLYKLRRKYEKKESRKHFSQFIYYLKKKGYIKIKNMEGKQGVMLTTKGREKVFKARLKAEKAEKREDGKWLMIIFDIPEKKHFLRDSFRDCLKSLGFKMLQQSVWVCPFNVMKKVEEIVQRRSLDLYIRLFLIEEIDV